jgi:Animal haem peroxidase
MPNGGKANTIRLLSPTLPPAREIPSGTRHIFGSPRPDQCFRIHDYDPLDTLEDQNRARSLMRKLSLRVEAEISWREHNSYDAKRWENPFLPSGYAYLFQFVGHDLVNTTAPFSSVPRNDALSANARRSALRLETLYGDGPTTARFAYEPSDRHDGERVRLRLGRIQRDDRTIDAGCPFRDIARAPRDETGAIRPRELTEPLIADSRNDAHAILSQLTSVFALLHNGIVTGLEGSEPAGRRPAHAHALFAKARTLCARAYRRVVEKDLLRRLLDPAVYRAYESGFLLDATATAAGWKAPLEFSQGAIRFGHAMVRDEYRINDGATNDLIENLAKTSLADPRNMPLNESWVVQWSHFFEMGDGRKPNLSKRIGPHYSSGLASERIFPAIDDSHRFGLAYRDLLSSAFSGLWSLRSLIEEIRSRRPEFVHASRLLDDHAWRQWEIAHWLREQRAFGGLDAEDISAISRDPPLCFFVQWEAMREADGLRLGPLGSIIVAETVFAALATPINEQFGRSGDISIEPDEFGTVHRTQFERLSQVQTMPDLISFVRDVCGLSHAVPAFA